MSAFSALDSKLINIPDVYESNTFDFMGPKTYDAMTGYKTTSMLVVPMEDAQNFDEAFRRRIKFIIPFPLHSATSRLEMWRRVFPADCPLEEDIHLGYLAENFEFSGSNKKNMAVAAAFLAAARDSRVSMAHILTAAYFEIAKTGRTLTRGDLKEYNYLYDELLV